MESGSQSESLLDRPQRKLSNIMGTLIAILTLTLPLLVIAYYSQPAQPNLPASYVAPARQN